MCTFTQSARARRAGTLGSDNTEWAVRGKAQRGERHGSGADNESGLAVAIGARVAPGRSAAAAEARLRVGLAAEAAQAQLDRENFDNNKRPGKN